MINSKTKPLLWCTLVALLLSNICFAQNLLAPIDQELKAQLDSLYGLQKQLEVQSEELQQAKTQTLTQSMDLRAQIQSLQASIDSTQADNQAQAVQNQKLLTQLEQLQKESQVLIAKSDSLNQQSLKLKSQETLITQQIQAIQHNSEPQPETTLSTSPKTEDTSVSQVVEQSVGQSVGQDEPKNQEAPTESNTWEQVGVIGSLVAITGLIIVLGQSHQE